MEAPAANKEAKVNRYWNVRKYGNSMLKS